MTPWRDCSACKATRDETATRATTIGAIGETVWKYAQEQMAACGQGLPFSEVLLWPGISMPGDIGVAS